VPFELSATVALLKPAEPAPLRPRVQHDMPKPPHHAGDFDTTAAHVRAQANADPNTTCWRCGNTLDQCRPHRDGTPARWTAGHLRDDDPTSPILAECSPCNYRHGEDG